MNNRLAVEVTGLALCGLLLTVPVAAAELEIAVLDTQRAIVSTEEAQALMEKAQSELQEEETEVNALGEELLALQQQLEQDGEIMSPSEQRRIQKEIEDKQIDYQYLVNKLQKQLNDKRQELLQVMAPKLNAVLEDLIALEGYDLIMERANLRVRQSQARHNAPGHRETQREARKDRKHPIRSAMGAGPVRAFRLGDLAERLDGEVIGDAGVEITGCRQPGERRSRSHQPPVPCRLPGKAPRHRRIRGDSQTRRSCRLPHQRPDRCESVPRLREGHPTLGRAAAPEPGRFTPVPTFTRAPPCTPTARVGPNVVVGPDTEVGPGVRLYANAVVGPRCVLDEGSAPDGQRDPVRGRQASARARWCTRDPWWARTASATRPMRAAGSKR